MTILPVVLNGIVYIALAGISIYALVLFIKLAKRGIKALDIYIDEKTREADKPANELQQSASAE